MKTRKLICVGILFLFTYFHTMAQEKGSYYYYYMGKKQYLTLDKTRLNVTTTADFDKSALDNKLNLKSLRAEKGETESRTKFGSIRFLSTPSDAEYDQAISSLKSREDVVAVNPNFLSGGDDTIRMTSRFYVKLKERNDYARLEQFAGEKKVAILMQNQFMPLWYLLQCTQETVGNTLSVANDFYESGLFASAEPEFLYIKLHSDASVPATVVPIATTDYCNDPLFPDQWGLKNDSAGIDMKVYQAWSLSQGAGIKVALIDRGMDTTHIDLAANISPLSYDAVTESSPSQRDVYSDHGIYCAGIIGAVKDNNIHIAGVAPQCTIIPISVNAFSPDPWMYANGIDWAWRNGADVINCSWGTSDTISSEILKNAIDSALIRGRGGKGCVIIFSAGNSSRQIGFPANSNPDLIVVAAICKDGSRHPTSNYGNCLDFVAPGDRILTIAPGNRTAYAGQSSMAAAHVSGVAALMLSYNPFLSVKDIHYILSMTPRKIPGPEPYYPGVEIINMTRNSKMGYGLIDAYSALEECRSVTFVADETIKGNKTAGDYIVVVDEVIVQPGAKLSIGAVEEVHISNLDVQLGGELEIKMTGL